LKKINFIEKGDFMSLFKDEIVGEFLEWKNANPDNFTWWNFVNIKADIDTALAFAKFYSPELLEIEGYCLLKDKFSPNVFEGWKRSCQNNKECVEKMMNIYQIRDFFHINTIDSENENEKFKALGRILKFFWEITFEKNYPEKKLKVHLFEEDDGELFITVYSL
jgi:hypothetical protein